LVYLGSPEPAVVPLRALVDAGHDVALVVSRADARRGRGGAPTPSPVKHAARALGLPVSDRVDDVVATGAQLGVVVAYGRIVPAVVLDAVPMVNVHFSLLPRWRGAAPVQRAILAGDPETGVSLMRVDEGLDTGPVLAAETVAIAPGEHASRLSARLAEVGARLLVDALRDGVEALPPGRPQQGEPNYATKIEPGELRLDWTCSAVELERLVRLDGAWTTFRGKRLLVLEAHALVDPRPADISGAAGTLHDNGVLTGAGMLVLEEVQPAGKRPVPTDAWRRGARPVPGERFGGPEDPR
jgi:methionyl-tRNA formyltransferase